MSSEWKTAKLGSLCRIAMGGTPPRNITRYFDKSKTSGYVWLSIADLPVSGGRWVNESKEHLSSEGASRVRAVAAGTLLVSFKLSLGRLAFAGRELRTNEAIAALCELDERVVSKEYLYWFLTHFDWQKAAEGEDKIKGKTLNKAKLEQIEIRYPPLAEQQRIVAILAEAFDGLAQVTANVRRQEAAIGEMFDRRIDEILSGDEEWETLALGDVCTLQRGFDLPVQDRKLGSAPLISSSGFIALQSEAPIKAPGVVTGRSGSIGKVFWVEDDFWPLNTTLFVKDFHGNDQRFVFRLLQRFDLARFAGGAGVPTLNRNAVHGEQVCIPPSRKVQQEVAAQIDVLECERDRLLGLSSSKLGLAVELRKSLLARAFSSETAADPDIANAAAFATSEQTANILAFMHWRHERANRSRFFGHVMAQKTLDLVERVGGVELGRRPYKDAAGPNDKPHMTGAEVWARDNQFFEFSERPGGGYDFKKLANYGAMLSAAKIALKPIEAELDRVANILVGKDKVQAEIFATVLAAWNNLIIDGKDATEPAVLREAREDWHPDKIDLPIAKFRDAISEIRRLALVPDGTAKAVRHKQAALF